MEDKVEKNTQAEQQKEKRNEENLISILENMKCNNIRTRGIPEGKENRIKSLFEEIMTENFPNLV